MEHEGEVYRRCRFEGRLSDDEATILTYLESAVQQCETNEIALPASLTVVKDGQATLTPVSKEQAVWLMEKFELVATKSAEAGESAARQTCPHSDWQSASHRGPLVSVTRYRLSLLTGSLVASSKQNS